MAARLNGSGSLALAQLATEALTIGANGSGAVTVPHLAATTVDVSLSGSGSVTLAGQTQQQTISLSGSGRYAAGDLASQDAQARLSGSGSAVLRVAGDAAGPNQRQRLGPLHRQSDRDPTAPRLRQRPETG